MENIPPEAARGPDADLSSPASIAAGIAGFLRSLRQRPRAYYFAGAIIAAAAAGALFYQFVVLREELSEFELAPRAADAAGVMPTSSFILKSSANLSAAVVEKYVSFDPPAPFTIRKIASGSSVFEITPNAPLEADRVYAVSVAEGPIAARPYSWAYQVKAPFQIIGSTPRHEGSGVPINTAIEITFNRENLLGAEDAFSITPSVRGRFETHRNTIVFVPLETLKPKTVYTVVIAPTVRAAGSDDALAEPATVAFETAEERPYGGYSHFAFDRKFWEFRPDTEPVFGVSAYNIPAETASVAVYRFADADEFIAAHGRAFRKEYRWTQHHSFVPAELPADRRIFVSAALPLESQLNVQFIRVPQKLAEGFYLVDAVVGEHRRQAWFQMTSLASFSAASSVDSFLWVRNVVSGAPATGAQIARDGAAVARTGEDGAAVFPTPPEFIQQPNEPYRSYSSAPSFYTVSAGASRLVVPVENEYGYFWKMGAPDAWWKYFSLDKSVYAPTDTVRFWGVVRPRAGAGVAGEEVTIQLTNPFWQGTPKNEITVYAETKAVVSDFDTLTGELRFANLAPRLYQLTVRRGDEMIVSATVSVETYIKPAYTVSIAPDKNAAFADDTITYRAKASFFDGTPVARLRLSYDGYWNSSIKGTVALDENGEGTFTVRPGYFADKYEYWPRYFGIDVRPASAEEGQISAHASVLVFGPRIDIRSEETRAEKIAKFDFSIAHITLENIRSGEPWWNAESYRGEPARQWNVVANVIELQSRQTEIGRTYDPISKTTYPQYSYETIEIPVRSSGFITDGLGTAYYEFAPEDGKNYRVEFTARDQNGRVARRTHYVYGGSFSYFGMYDPRRAVMRNLDDKHEYRLREEMRFQMQSPGGGALPSGEGAFAFLELRNGKISYRISRTADYRKPFGDEDIPNVQVAGVWFTGSRFAGGYAMNASFDAQERQLQVEVATDRERYRPRDTASVKLRVTDRAGVPKDAEVSVAGVDEAIFAINPTEKDITNTLYQDAFSPLMTRASHMEPLGMGGAEKGCFAAGTAVSTPAGARPIESLAAGDEVWTRAGVSSDDPVRTRVVRASSHLVNGYVLVNGTLKLTANHTLFANGGWKKAGELRAGDMLRGEDGSVIRVSSAEFVPQWGFVYNIELAPHRTFFADGIWVHNEEKGGGGAREDFRDVALYQVLRTGADGEAEFSFTLPDNLTSWRITAEAVTKDLFAGKTVRFVPVGLPFFADAALNTTYLAGDAVTLRVRAFGTAPIPETIAYAVESETLPFKKIERRGGALVEIPLGPLPAGKHRLTISARAGNLSDAVVRELDVRDSYFSKTASAFYELAPDLSIRGAAAGYTSLVITSYERGRLYGALRQIVHAGGERIDQKIARRIADGLRERFFEEKRANAGPDIETKAYQTPNGGMALLPYSSSEFELSALFAHLASDGDIVFDRDGLRRYLKAALADRKTDTSRVVRALWGLTAFREPVLVSLRNARSEPDLALADKIYIASGLAALGAKEEARAYYEAEIRPSFVVRQPYISVGGMAHEDDAIIATALAAALAADIRAPEADGLGAYALQHAPERTLVNFERLFYLSRALPALRSGPVSFSYRTPRRGETVTLERNEAYRLEFSAEELAELRFGDIDGRIAAVAVFDEPATSADIAKDKSLGITRRYVADGAVTTKFSEGDLVRVELTPSFGPGALDGAYQVVDYLPSGLRPVTDWNLIPWYEGSRYSHPTGVDGQRVTFVTWKGSSERPISYYARAVSKGSYAAEPALVQSLSSAESANISAAASVIIE